MVRVPGHHHLFPRSRPPHPHRSPRSRCSRWRLRAEDVTTADLSVDQGLAEAPVDLAAECRDVHLDDVAVGLEIHVPDMLANLSPCEHTLGVSQEVFKERELLRR